jgi:hypothetical protein
MAATSFPSAQIVTKVCSFHFELCQRHFSSLTVLFLSLDVKVCDSEADHFLELRNELDRRRYPINSVHRSVMVFFDSKATLLSFYNSGHMVALKGIARIITEATLKCEKETAILKSTEPGAVTLMIREFGRGTDFKCFDTKMLQAGGVHVIQAFFSLDQSEEIQIKGRCARQGADGSFRYVVRGVVSTILFAFLRIESFTLVA